MCIFINVKENFIFPLHGQGVVIKYTDKTGVLSIVVITKNINMISFNIFIYSLT